MEKLWSKETRLLTMSPALGTVSAHTTGRLTESTDQTAAPVTGAAAGDEASRRFLLRVVQPGLAGLMDGSVSTLAPIFATAFATHQSFTAFLVGIAAALGAGISMAFSEDRKERVMSRLTAATDDVVCALRRVTSPLASQGEYNEVGKAAVEHIAA